MELLILRHADAVFDAPSDFDRQLSEKGVRQAHEVASFLKTEHCTPDLVLTSPAVRARSTAEVIGRELKVQVIECPWAVPGMYAEDAIRQLNAFSHFNRVLLVGHQPDLAELTARLLGMPNPDRLHIRKAALIHLRMLGGAGASLEAFVPCRLM
jgi:phosphohistidine phosphatase